ncbi:hypothetical protein ACHAXT_000039 [Thalassiosira profunda]
MAKYPSEETKAFCRIVLPTATAFVAFFLSLSATLRCNFIKFTSTAGFADPVTIQFGPWRHETLAFYSDGAGTVYLVEACTPYSDFGDGTSYMDTHWNSARAFIIIPVVLGGISLIALFTTEMTSCRVPKLHCLNSLSYILACLFQGLSLLFLNSNACKDNLLVRSFEGSNGIEFQETCSMSTGAKCAIAATVFWLVAAVASADAYRHPEKAEGDGGDDATLDASGLDEPLVGDSEHL